MDYLIGVDVGSSDCKVMILETTGKIITSSRQPYPTTYPQLNWAEQNAEDWYAAACAAIRGALEESAVAPQNIIGLAIVGPAHNAAVLGEDDKPVYPVIHWSDLRSIPQAKRLKQELGSAIFAFSYSTVNPSWTLPQLLWLKENEPRIWSRVRRVLVTKDYVRYRFTGVYQTDVYDAIGTQFYDIRANAWSDMLCELLELNPGQLPPTAPAQSIAGGLLPQAAKDCGLTAGIPVAVGSGDSVVEAFGIGAIRPGHGIIKLGTAANVNLVTATACPSPRSMTYPHVVGDSWFTITATNSGASTMRWFRDTFCRLEVQQAERDGLNVYQLIDQLASGAPPGSQGLLFHPYLNGERSPYWNPYLRGDFVGISIQHNAHHFARAILEGVAFSIRDCLSVVEGLGQPIEQLFLIGGGAKSHLWRQIICDVLGKPLVKPLVEDAAFGSAMLAGVAVGVFTDWEDAVQSCVRGAESLLPNEVLHQRYTEYFEVYRDITRDLAEHSRRLVDISERDETWYG